jgi:predicted transcriptional regulator
MVFNYHNILVLDKSQNIVYNRTMLIELIQSEVYAMSKRALTPQQEYRAYQLCVEDKLPQSKVASLYGVSQGTISNVVKEKKHEQEVAGYQAFMKNAAQYGIKSAIEDGLLHPRVFQAIDTSELNDD